MKSRLIVILNDNDMSIAPPVGAMSAILTADVLAQLSSLRELAGRMARRFPRGIERTARRAEEYARELPRTVGPCSRSWAFTMSVRLDGHNLDHLLPVLRNVREAEETGRSPGSRHHSERQRYVGGAVTRQVSRCLKVQRHYGRTGEGAPGPTWVKADGAIAEASKDPKVVAITAAMPSGTGLDRFAKIFPDRCFDVGIAEQHAVTFAAGMATEGMRPST